MGVCECQLVRFLLHPPPHACACAFLGYSHSTLLAKQTDLPQPHYIQEKGKWMNNIYCHPKKKKNLEKKKFRFRCFGHPSGLELPAPIVAVASSFVIIVLHAICYHIFPSISLHIGSTYLPRWDLVYRFFSCCGDTYNSDSGVHNPFVSENKS